MTGRLCYIEGGLSGPGPGPARPGLLLKRLKITKTRARYEVWTRVAKMAKVTCPTMKGRD